MKLLINQQDVPLDNIIFYNWFHLIDWLLKNRIDNRQGIVELKIDGKSYRHILSNMEAEPFPTDAELIEIQTQDAYAISQSGLTKSQSLLSTLIGELPPIVESFRSGDLAKGSGSLGQFIQSLIPIIDFIKSIAQNFQIDFSIQLIDKDLTIQDLIIQLQNFFIALNSAQERADSIELADLMEFELTTLLTNWQKAVSELKQTLPNTPLRTPPS